MINFLCSLELFFIGWLPLWLFGIDWGFGMFGFIVGASLAYFLIFFICFALSVFISKASFKGSLCSVAHSSHRIFPLITKLELFRGRKIVNLTPYIGFDVIYETIIAVVLGGPGSILWMILTLTALLLARTIKLFFFLDDEYSHSGKLKETIKKFFCYLFIYIAIFNSTVSQANQILTFSANVEIISSANNLAGGITRFAFDLNYYFLSLIVIFTILLYPNKKLTEPLFAIPSLIIYISYIACASCVTLFSKKAGIYFSFQQIMMEYEKIPSILFGITAACSAWSHIIYKKENINNMVDDSDDANNEQDQFTDIWFEYCITVITCLTTGFALISSQSFYMANTSEDAIITLNAISNMFKTKVSIRWIIALLSIINLIRDSHYQQNCFNFKNYKSTNHSKMSYSNAIIGKIITISPVIIMCFIHYCSNFYNTDMTIETFIAATDVLIAAVVIFSFLAKSIIKTALKILFKSQNKIVKEKQDYVFYTKL